MTPDPSTVLPQGADLTLGSGNPTANTTAGLNPVPNSTLQSASPDVVPVTPIIPQDLATQALVDGESMLKQQTLDEQTAQSELKQAEKGYDNSVSTGQSLESLLLGKTADQQRLENEQNLPEINTELRSLQTLKKKQTAEYIQGLKNIEAGNIRSLSTNQQVALYRQRAIDSLLTDSLISAKQNDQLTAQAQVDRALSLKYDPILQRIQSNDKYIERKYQSLSRADKKLADAKLAKNATLKEETERKREQEKLAQTMIVNATPYAPTSVTMNAQKLLKEGKSPTEVAIALGKYGGDYLGDMVKRSTIAKNNKDIEKTAAEIKALQTPLPTNAPQGSNAAFTANLLNSAVNKESLSQTERTAVTKNLTVLDQLDSLEQNIKTQNKTGFIKGKVNNLLASVGQNADVGTINAQLQAIVPNLARGVYGEVGVLTDNDIANYRKTLPNLTSPNAQNDAVLALTLKVVQKNLKNTLETAANSKMDVSRFVPQYQAVTNKINEINDRIGATDIQVKDYADLNPQVKPMVEQLIKDGKKGSEILQILGVEY
jgi:hypothetical protein